MNTDSSTRSAHRVKGITHSFWSELLNKDIVEADCEAEMLLGVFEHKYGREHVEADIKERLRQYVAECGDGR